MKQDEKSIIVNVTAWAAILALFCILAVLALSPGCGPVVIPPVPAPPTTTTTTTLPPEAGPVVRLTAGGSDFIRSDGQATRKCVACCKGTAGTGWPGVSVAELQFLHDQGLCNMIQWRVGPFTSGNESEWKVTEGGAYVESPDGRADLTQFNPVYWDVFEAGIDRAAELDMIVEVSLLDGWGIKTECWRSNAAPGEKCAWHPWHRAGNIQGQDHLTSAWRGTNPDPVQLAYLQQVFARTVRHRNVIYEGGTETDQLVGKAGRTAKEIVDCDLTQEALLRQAEAAAGVEPHLYGTNFAGDASYGWLRKGRLQFQNVHKTQPQVGFFDPKDFLRPVMNDEYNPEPPMQAKEVQAFACYSRAHGAYWAAWRHDQDENPWKASLSLIAQDSIAGCSAKAKSGCAFDVLPVVRVDCGRFSGNQYDCSPKNSRGQAILPEGGTNSRALCEEAMAGLAPGQGVTWSSSSPTVQIVSNANRWKFTIRGAVGAKAILSCRIPSTGAADACHGVPLEVQ